MSIKSLFSWFLVTALMASCTQNNQAASRPGPSPSPEITPEIHSMGVIRVGVVERNFNQHHLATCIYDESKRTTIVTFEATDSSSSFSIRVSNSLVDRLYVSLGTNQDNDNYSTSRTLNPGCTATLQPSKNGITGSFQCTGLSNAASHLQTVSGNFLCRIQSPEEWNW